MNAKPVKQPGPKAIARTTASRLGVKNPRMPSGFMRRRIPQSVKSINFSRFIQIGSI
jgi:hypothetical protein